MVKQKAHGRVATCPKPTGEKQGRLWLSQTRSSRLGPDVTGGIKKGVSYVGYRASSVPNSQVEAASPMKGLNDRPRLCGGAVKRGLWKRPLFEDLSILSAPLFHASSLGPNFA